jgi:hypothetical protein
VLRRDPTWTQALEIKAYDLLKLGKPAEALDSLNQVRDFTGNRGGGRARWPPPYITLLRRTSLRCKWYSRPRLG